ncbi:MAG: DUF4145 domain-containing protein [Pseudomonadota bacterium]
MGTARTDVHYDYDHEGKTVTIAMDYFYPEFIHPSPSLISLVEETPQDVAEEVVRASALVWADTSSSANKLRLTAERVLTALKIKRSKISNGKRRPLTLNERIALLPHKYLELGELLHSIRFLGNHGSHENASSVDRNDLLNAFEIMEHVVEVAFSKKAKRVKTAAKEIKKRKGKPASKKRSVW